MSKVEQTSRRNKTDRITVEIFAVKYLSRKETGRRRIKGVETCKGNPNRIGDTKLRQVQHTSDVHVRCNNRVLRHPNEAMVRLLSTAEVW